MIYHIYISPTKTIVKLELSMQCTNLERQRPSTGAQNERPKNVMDGHPQGIKGRKMEPWTNYG